MPLLNVLRDVLLLLSFFFIVPATTEIYTLSLHDALPIFNGCCLTVTATGEGWWAADAVDETLSRTNLDRLASGDPVNFERPVRLSDRLGGHLVQGQDRKSTRLNSSH